jgi:hypothetical protein
MLRWAGHVARMAKRINTLRILDGKPKERDHSLDLYVDGLNQKAANHNLNNGDSEHRDKFLDLRARNNKRTKKST